MWWAPTSVDSCPLTEAALAGRAVEPCEVPCKALICSKGSLLITESPAKGPTCKYHHKGKSFDMELWGLTNVWSIASCKAEVASWHRLVRGYDVAEVRAREEVQ